MTRPSRLTPAFALLLGVTAALAGCTASQEREVAIKGTGPAMPTEPTVYVETQCSFTTMNSLLPTDPTLRANMPSPTHPGPDGRGGAIPADFTPVSVIGCAFGEENVSGDGTWRVATQTATDSPLGDLIAAYRTPAPTVSAPPGADFGCTTQGDPDPVLAFVDAHGTAIWPAPPRDTVCRHISSRVTKALKALRWTVTKSQRVMHLAAQGGCHPDAGHGTALFSLAGNTEPATSGPYFKRTPTRQLAVCVYKIRQSGGPLLDGVFEREIVLSGSALTKAVDALDAAPAAAKCSDQPTRYAELIGDADPAAGAQGDQDGYVELDGCRRVGTINTGGGKPPGLRQLDAAAIAALTPGG